MAQFGFKHKDYVPTEWMVAMALQQDGWYFRSPITWMKTAPQPESCTDRPSKGTEMIFMLTKSERYYYDRFSVRRELTEATATRDKYSRILDNDGPQAMRNNHETICDRSGGNLWNWWVGPPASYKGSHYAVFPNWLPRTCIKLASSEKGCCPQCGAGWVRVVDRIANKVRPPEGGVQAGSARDGEVQIGGNNCGTNSLRDGFRELSTTTIGWKPGCECDVTSDAGSPIPCTVLDPFCGVCTTAIESLKLGRHFIGIELNEGTVKDAHERIKTETSPSGWNDDTQNLF